VTHRRRGGHAADYAAAGGESGCPADTRKRQPAGQILTKWPDRPRPDKDAPTDHNLQLPCQLLTEKLMQG